MTKLEEKLKELGYTYIYHNDYFKKKSKLSKFMHICIYLNCDKTEIDIFGIEYKSEFITKQEQIDNLQKAFNEMQKDLEVLKEYEVCRM